MVLQTTGSVATNQSPTMENFVEGNTPKILIVDDEAYMQCLIQHHLTRAGFEVLKASTGKEAIQMAEENIPDLVIMDYMLPQMNGLDVLQHLKGNRNTSHIPIIMMTANSFMVSQEEAESSGAAMFCTKPFSPTQLVQIIKRLTHLAA